MEYILSPVQHHAALRLIPVRIRGERDVIVRALRMFIDDHSRAKGLSVPDDLE